MSEQQYHISKLSINIGIFIIGTFLTFFLGRYVFQQDKNHNDVMETLKNIECKISKIETDQALTEQWKKSMDDWKKLVDERPSNTRGGKPSKVEGEQLLNRYNIYRDSASFAIDY